MPDIRFFSNWPVSVSTCGVLGRSPFAPGTVGTLAGIPAALLVFAFPPWMSALACIALVIGAIWAVELALPDFPEKDPGAIVLDEVAGYVVTLMGIPIDFSALVAAFVIFRVLDILKPPPVRQLERSLPGGAGVVADDVMAGVMGCLIMHLGLWILS